jgi:hypothetical protein
VALRNGESVYGTRGAPYLRPWGHDPERRHRLRPRDGLADETLALPRLPGKVIAGRFVKDGSRAAFAERRRCAVAIPAGSRDDIDTVVALTIAPDRK